MNELIKEARELCELRRKQKHIPMSMLDKMLELCDALEKAEERGTGCEHCRGWDKRCGASFCPMCGRELEEYHEDD